MPLKPVTLSHGGQYRQGEAMITARGIEGGAIYALSAGLRESIARDGQAVLELDLRPGMSREALLRKLQNPRGGQSLSSHLRKAGFSPLAIGLLREVIPAERLTQASPEQLTAWLQALPLTLTATTGLERAISTAGGITRAAMNEHFMLHALPGIFATGEMLDWEAPTGGYLLQGCFSTAVAAANGILDFCAKSAS